MRYLSSGFSHGASYTAILEGLPSNFDINEEEINSELMKRQAGYGRSHRMSIERDRIEIISGVIDGKTTGAPLVLSVKNLVNERISFTTPRAGHADLATALKYNLTDLSLVAEGASARETVMATAIGAISKSLLKKLGVFIVGRITNIKGETSKEKIDLLIDKAREEGDTLGGGGEVTVKGAIAGLGSYTRGRRLDAKLAGAIISIPSIKAVEFGLGKGFETVSGSECMDTITLNGRENNNAGGIEGGTTNGEDIVIKFSVKPIPTLQKEMPTIDLSNLSPSKTVRLRGDVCVVDSVIVVAESVIAYELLNEILASTGGDTLEEVIERYNKKRQDISKRLTKKQGII